MIAEFFINKLFAQTDKQNLYLIISQSFQHFKIATPNLNHKHTKLDRLVDPKLSIMKCLLNQRGNY